MWVGNKRGHKLASTVMYANSQVPSLRRPSYEKNMNYLDTEARQKITQSNLDSGFRGWHIEILRWYSPSKVWSDGDIATWISHQTDVDFREWKRPQEISQDCRPCLPVNPTTSCMFKETFHWINFMNS